MFDLAIKMWLLGKSSSTHGQNTTHFINLTLKSEFGTIIVQAKGLKCYPVRTHFFARCIMFIGIVIWFWEILRRFWYFILDFPVFYYSVNCAKYSLNNTMPVASAYGIYKYDTPRQLHWLTNILVSVHTLDATSWMLDITSNEHKALGTLWNIISNYQADYHRVLSRVTQGPV